MTLPEKWIPLYYSCDLEEDFIQKVSLRSVYHAYERWNYS
jgi:hypothetical protein